MAEMKKLIPKNDYERNKDRQDPIAVLKLSNDKLVDQLSKVGYVIHTNISETTKYTEKKKLACIQTLLIFLLVHTGIYSW